MGKITDQGLKKLQETLPQTDIIAERVATSSSNFSQPP
jgi:hypothetical protein